MYTSRYRKIIASAPATCRARGGGTLSVSRWSGIAGIALIYASGRGEEKGGMNRP